MRGLGQIEYLTQFAQPDVGVVVNVGTAHVGVVGSVEAIAKGKSEIWGRLPEGGAAIYPHGDARLTALAHERAPAARHLTFGEEAEADVRLVSVEPRGVEGSDAVVAVRGRNLNVRVPLVGRHNALNATCALAVAVALGVDLDAAVRGIATATPAAQRSEVRTIGGRHVLVDCYNANPASMKAALSTLADLAAETKGSRGVAVLGDMLELGSTENGEHAALGKLVAEQKHRAADHARRAGAAGSPASARAAGVAARGCREHR